MLDDNTDKYLDKLWFYFKKTKQKPQEVLQNSPKKSFIAYTYLLLLQSIHEKKFPEYVESIRNIITDVLTDEQISLILEKANLITEIATALKKKSKKKLPPHIQSIIQQLGTIQINKLVKYIISTYFILDNNMIPFEKEFEGFEFKYIEILESSVDTVDYSMVENLFNTTEVKNGTAEALYQMIMEQEFPTTLISVDRKINRMFEKKLIIPITDEFLRYHKETERIDTSDATKKLDKIRYTVSKLNQFADMYSSTTGRGDSRVQSTKQTFYQPLVNRKAILYNDTDEINAIMKLVKMGKTAIRSNENFPDLVNYRNYAFINFHDFKNYGFRLKFNQTTDAVRVANFEYNENQKIPLMWRVAGYNNKANIVGLALPRHLTSLIKPTNYLQCMNVKNTKDLHKIYPNGYDVFVKKLEHIIIDNAVYKKMGYWLFDKNTDRIRLSQFQITENAEINDMNFEQYFKLITGSLYDKITEMAYFCIKQQLHDNMTIYDATNLIENIEHKLLPLDEYIPFIYQDVIYEKTKQFDLEYDTNEDKIPGLNKKIKKVPRIVEKENAVLKVVALSKKDIITTDMIASNIPPNSICQHIISWNNIRSNIKATNYNQLLFEFIKKYVRDGANNEYICKSCYQNIDLKKYVHDFSSTTEGVSMSFALESQLDKLPEYDKFNKFIKYMDKIIERFAYVADISYYLGNLPQIKLRRQEIIRRVIDFINIQYITIKNITPAERGEKEKQYGIKDLNQFFIFELKNEIITFSSKDTDKFKLLKRNNIYSYMMLFIIIDMNMSQIYNLERLTIDKSTKPIKYNDFKKVSNLFDGILIRTNNANQLQPILKYPILCYVIYICAQVIIKSKLWNSETDSTHRLITANIINTLVFMLNTLLETSSKSEKDYRYELFSTNFFTKLYNIYSQNNLFTQMEQTEIYKRDVTHKDIALTGTLEKIHFDDVVYLAKPMVKFGKHPIVRDISIPKQNILNLEQQLHQQNLIKLFKIYKLDGTKRPESEKPTDKDIEKVTNEELQKMYNNIIKKKKIISEKQQEYEHNKATNIQIEKERLKDFNKKIISKVSLYDTVIQFIKKVEAIIGSNININNSNLYLSKNAYIIQYDVKGTKLREPIIALEGDKQLIFKKNDNIFKTDIYTYHDIKTNIHMYYHAKELYFLGYRDSNGKMNRINQKNAYLQINYSVQNKLLFLGLMDLFIDTKKYNFIIRQRIANLKNILVNIQKLLYQVQNKFRKTDTFIREYIAKFKTFEMVGNDEKKVFVDVPNVIASSFFDTKRATLKDTFDTVFAQYLLKVDNTDHDIIKYICSEMSKLIDINQDKYSKINIGFLLATIIDHEFNRYHNYTTINHNNTVKLINILSVFQDVQVYEDYEEIVDRLIKDQDEEAITNNAEEIDAMDAKQDAPEEGDDMGDEDVVFMPDY